MALTASRARSYVKAKTLSLPGTVQQVYKGGIACWDTSTGLVAKAAASTTMIPIGLFAEDKNVTSGQEVVVDLFREVDLEWIPNSGSDAVVAADLGKLVFLADDNTVRKTDNTNACSVAGRAWKLSATQGVLVEFVQTATHRIGGLDV